MARMKRSDPAHAWTDEEIKRIEREISKEYKQAHEEAVKKTQAYFNDFKRKDSEWRVLVDDGKVTEKEYIAWRRGQMLVGKRWEGLCETLAEDYTNAAKIAMSITKEHAPEVYAVNHNYSTFEVEKSTGLDTSYTLYSRETIERMYREDPKLYHDYGKAVEKDIREGKQKPWDKRRVKSVLTQAVLQGESIPKITKRLEIVTGGDHKAAIRNARTMITGVQNAGRIDAMKRANDLGIPTKKQWLATVDGRTRHWHRELDGVIKDIDEPFENEFGKIMFPADPDADGANVYNCRCTLLSAIKGFELDVTDPNVRPMPKLKDMSYEEWKNEKKPANGKQAPSKAPQKTQSASDIKPIEFTPAKTIEEAEDYARKYCDESRFGALGVSYNGVSVEVANEINRTIGRFYETFNVEKFGGIIAPAGNTKYGKQIQGATAAYSDIRRSFFLNRKSLKTLDTANKAFKAEYNVVVDILAHPEKYDLSKVSAQVRRVIENSKTSGRGTIPQTIEEAINHELGHSLEREIKKSDLWDQIKNNMDKYNKKLSGYACENASEYIAESFCSYMKGEDKIDPVLKNVFDSMRR